MIQMLIEILHQLVELVAECCFHRRTYSHFKHLCDVGCMRRKHKKLQIVLRKQLNGNWAFTDFMAANKEERCLIADAFIKFCSKKWQKINKTNDKKQKCVSCLPAIAAVGKYRMTTLLKFD